MGAFELQDTPILADRPDRSAGRSGAGPAGPTDPTGPVGPFITEDHRKVKDESIITHKVYDSCRRQNCLTSRELGPARNACFHQEGETEHGHDHHHSGSIIEPPQGAVSVTMDKVTISRIKVVDKQPSPFRNGYWDIDIRYVFEYRLTFRDAGGCILDKVPATSIFNMKATLFGSVGADLVIGTDLYKGAGETFAAAPFIWVEAKAVGLDAKLCHHHGHSHDEVHITIGLFSILKLFRLVHLNVQSKGFTIPDECQDQGDINPCEYFADLDFPMDIFAPPQRKEFVSGVSENIARGILK